MRTLLFIMNIMYYISYWILSFIYRKKPLKISQPDPLFTISATKLAKMIRQREIESYQVVYAYTERIKEVNRVLNAVVDNRYGPAIIEAKICDEQLAGKFDAETLEKEKPLYGVPITIKECYAVKGASYTGCSLTRKGVKATADSAVVELLRNAGAIPLCVTNTPEMCSNLDTSNRLYGNTLNPYDTRYSPGGSSGGEAALLATGASLIGIGSDLLGSIRLPAHFCGVFGYRPTSKMISIEGCFPYCEDKLFQSCFSVGPLARYAEDIELLIKVMTSKCNHDLRLTVPVDLKQLKVYYLPKIDNSYGIRPTLPEIEQCVLKAANHFNERGIHTKKLPINLQPTIIEMVMTSLLTIKDLPPLVLSNDPKVQKNSIMEAIKALFGLSQHTSATIFFSFLLQTHFPFTKSDISYYTQQREQIRQKLLDLLGENDVLICPTYRSPAIFQKLMCFEFVNAMYTSVFSVLGFPALHVPMGLNHEGLPIGVQVVVAPYQDRLCLAVAKELERAFGGWTPPFCQQ
ncbi:fatty-acid amide hydrolase 2-like isoform X2 [Odontomachus brunneus]|nr:fatty-acid amide hydrolase 2-like isoform X2 [Odontomachus brunneus]